MAVAKSSIEWTESTWNPVTGCTKVSDGCTNCYAERLTERFHGKGSFEQVQLHADRLDQPLRWRKPRRVFVNSMSDLFHEQVPDDYIARVFAVMALTPQHTYQILTKRHGRMRAWINRCAVSEHGWLTHDGTNPARAYGGTGEIVGPPEQWPLPNVWLGVSVEDQRWADIRIPALLDTPAAVRFLSCEPLLGPVNLEPFLWGLVGSTASYFGRNGKVRLGGVGGQTVCSQPLNALHWVITGGESGPGARPCDPDWVRDIRDQCNAARVPFFHKQNGGIRPKSNGRQLDGRTWDEMPTVAR